MFHLEKAVQRWTDEIFPRGAADQERIAELQDHLFSAVADLALSGMSQEQAFNAVIARIGRKDELASEFMKNDGLLESLCEAISQFEPERSEMAMEPKKRVKRTLMITLAYLGLLVLILFVAARLLAGSGQYEKVSLVIFFLWLGPLLIYTGSKGKSKAELAWFHRQFRRVFGGR